MSSGAPTDGHPFDTQVRGGSWNTAEAQSRAASRIDIDQNSWIDGLRLVTMPTQSIHQETLTDEPRTSTIHGR